MRQRLLLTALLSTTLLSGCASWFESSTGPKPTPLRDVATLQAIKPNWTASGLGNTAAGFTPVYDRGNVIAADKEGRIVVLDASTGRETARFDLKRELVSGVAVAADRLLVGTGSGSLLAVDRHTGKTLWEAPLTSVTLEAAQVGGEVAVVRTNDSRLTGLNVKDGSQLWSVGRLAPQLIVRDTGSMQVVGAEAVLVGMPAGKLVVASLSSGATLWEGVVANARGATELERVTDVVSRPVFNGNDVCAVAYQGRVACFEARTGNLAWAREVSSSRGIALDVKNVYVTGEDGSVSAFDRTSGRNVWKLDDLKNRNISGPVMLGRYVLVADAEGYAHLLSNESGAIVGRLRLDTEGWTGQPVSVGESVLIQGRNGRLSMLSLG
ncbi:outer membrane protein assembly factor BamB [Paludibacterium paludis]|uniref:Outer membrane protein assembly factor BamB n=1 Tax=Paludibacterium paludis TaxID=1225769 RepID=A0A918U817_9NEIS|nr:outer membrane protein assembly factor BamB [Paludibacterium paludis]GGY05416.1 outer membrane protein assembly factor BamB [Paludibacterium paludis]